MSSTHPAARAVAAVPAPVAAGAPVAGVSAVGTPAAGTPAAGTSGRGSTGTHPSPGVAYPGVPYPAHPAHAARSTPIAVPGQVPHQWSPAGGQAADGWGLPGATAAVPPRDRPTPLTVAAFAVGLLSFLLCPFPPLGTAAVAGGAVGALLGVVALRRVLADGGSKDLAVAGLSFSGVALVVAVLLQLVVGGALDRAATAAGQAPGDAAGTAAADAAAPGSHDGSPGTSDSAAAPDADGGAALDGAGASLVSEDQDAAADVPAAEPVVLLVGESAEVGDYSVTVTAVDTAATDRVMAVDPLNEAPAGQYVLVELDVVYNGPERGNPYEDLMLAFVGGDARLYDESTCGAVTAEPGTALTAVGPSGATDYQVCMDVPADVIQHGVIYVQDLLATEEVGALWAVL